MKHDVSRSIPVVQMPTDGDIKPYGYIDSESQILVETPPPAKKVTREAVAAMASAMEAIEDTSTTTDGVYARKLISTDLILEGQDSRGEDFVFAGSAYSIISNLVRRKIDVSKTKNLHLKNYKGETLLRSYNVYRDNIIQFLIYESTGRMLGSVNSKTYVFECEFDKGTYYFDIYYVLHRPSNTEFNGMKRISLYDKKNQVALSNIFEMYGKLDISETLKEWTKNVHGYEGWGQANSEKEISEIRDMFETVCNLMTPTKVEEDTTETADRTEEIKAFAISEQLDRVRELVNGDDKELTLKHLDVLQYLIGK